MSLHFILCFLSKIPCWEDSSLSNKLSTGSAQCREIFVEWLCNICIERYRPALQKVPNVYLQNVVQYDTIISMNEYQVLIMIYYHVYMWVPVCPPTNSHWCVEPITKDKSLVSGILCMYEDIKSKTFTPFHYDIYIFFVL